MIILFAIYYLLIVYVLISICEQLEPVQQAKHSSSAVEVATCFSQVREIWLQLAWPDSAGAFIFVTRLTDVSATSSVATHVLTSCMHTNTTLNRHTHIIRIIERFYWY